MSSSKRIMKELADLRDNPPAGASIDLAPSQDIRHWNVTLLGPADTPFESGIFALIIRLPTEYPFKPPMVRFGTRLYHPNVTNDSLGSICLGLLKSENWKPSTQMRAVIEAVRALLIEPQPDDPLEARIADEFRADRAAWEAVVRQYVALHASKKEPEFKDDGPS